MRSLIRQRIAYLHCSPAILFLILIAFVARCLLIDRDIVDDAAISLSYARNVAHGYGFVLNPGGERVEGFSNILLVLLLASGFKLGLFDLLTYVISPSSAAILYLKLVGLVFGIGSLVIAYILPRIVYHAAPDDSLNFFTPLYLTTSTTFATWSVMGLENPMYSFFILFAMYRYLSEQSHERLGLGSGLLFFCIALIRPEGVLYFGVALIHRVIVLGTIRHWPNVHDLRWLLVFVGCYGLFLAWRYSYFGYVVPNTFYAKVGGRDFNHVAAFLAPGLHYITHFVTQYNLLALLVFALFALLPWHHWRSMLLCLGVLSGGLLYIVYVGGDWWHEFRFISPLLPVFSLLVQYGLVRVRRCLAHKRMAFPLLCTTVGLLIILPNIASTRRYVNAVPFRSVAAQAQYWQQIVAQVGLVAPSYLGPDIGGVSFIAPELRIVDLGMLADIHTARFKYYPRFFKQYIFDEERPELLHTHGGWTRASRITSYPELREHYLPITFTDDEYGGSGDFIRKDVFVSRPSLTPAAQQIMSFGEAHLLDFQPSSLIGFPGQQQRFTWSWTCDTTCHHDYTFHLELRDSTGQPVVSESYQPVFGWYPTSHWQAGEVIREPRILRLPDHLPTGRYQVVIGVSAGAPPTYHAVTTLTVDAAAAKDRAQTLFTTSIAAVNRQQWADAMARLKLAVSLDPGTPAYQRSLQSVEQTWQQTLIETARQALTRNEVSGAAAAIERAKGIHTLPPAGRRIQHAIAAAFVEQGETAFQHHEYAAAYQHFRRAITVDPAHVWARHRLEDTRERQFYIDYYCDTVQYEKLYRIYLEERAAGNVPTTPHDYERLYGCLASVADTATLQELQAKAPPLTPLNHILTDTGGTAKLRVRGYTLDQTGINDTRLNMYFEVLDSLDKDYTIWMHGMVDDLTLLPADRRPYGFANFDHVPHQATSTWKVGRTYVDSFVIPAKPGTYRLTVGLYDPGDHSQLCSVPGPQCRIDLGPHILK